MTRPTKPKIPDGSDAGEPLLEQVRQIRADLDAAESPFATLAALLVASRLAPELRQQIQPSRRQLSELHKLFEIGARHPVMVFGAGELGRRTGLDPDRVSLSGLAGALAGDSLAAALQVAIAESTRPRWGVRIGTRWIGQDGQPAGRRVEVVPAVLPWDERRRVLRASAWSEVPGGGRYRSTRAANANKREARLLFEAQLREREDGERVTIEDLAAEPEPSALAELVEAEERGAELSRLRSAARGRERPIINRLCDGQAPAEVARALGFSRSAVYVCKHRVKRRLSRM